MAWSIYPGGDARVPNQAEYYSNWNPTTKTYNRNNPNHVMLGNMNYIYVEDMGGIQPRSDDKIELWPIDLGYDHFMVNNLRYHGHDVTIVWDPDGTKYNLGAGYSLFIDGDRKVSAASLGHLTYDPNTNQVDAEAGVQITFQDATGADFPSAVETAIEDERVVSYLKTAGIDLTEDAPNLVAGAALSSSYTQQGTRPTPWRQFHTPGYSSSSMNHTPGAIGATERPVSLDAINDGQTVNEPYWGNYGSPDANGYVEVDFGQEQQLDNVKAFFVSDRQAGGYNEPARWFVQVPDGDGGWHAVPEQFKSPAIPAGEAQRGAVPGGDHEQDSDRVHATSRERSPRSPSSRPSTPAGRSRKRRTRRRWSPPPGTARATATCPPSWSRPPPTTACRTTTSSPTAGRPSRPAGAARHLRRPGRADHPVTGTVAGDYIFRFAPTTARTRRRGDRSR